MVAGIVTEHNARGEQTFFASQIHSSTMEYVCGLVQIAMGRPVSPPIARGVASLILLNLLVANSDHALNVRPNRTLRRACRGVPAEWRSVHATDTL